MNKRIEVAGIIKTTCYCCSEIAPKDCFLDVLSKTSGRTKIRLCVSCREKVIQIACLLDGALIMKSLYTLEKVKEA